MYSRCKECQYAFVNSKPKKIYTLKKTKPKLVWEKRAERIKQYWSEWKVFVEIWIERVNEDWKRICDNCWKHIKFFHSSCFAHKLNKRDNPKLRYEKTNIALVHWIWEIQEEKTSPGWIHHQRCQERHKVCGESIRSIRCSVS